MVEIIENKKRILVVGGNGFIGRHIVAQALDLDWDVTCLSLNSRNDQVDNSPKVKYVIANISDHKVLKEALGDAIFEYVVNCGGYIDHTLFLQGGRNVLETHFLGVLNLVGLLNRDSLLAYINIGSSDEYGNITAPQLETNREAPISPYSMGKVAATHFLQMLFKTENFPATTLRLFLVYGPGQDVKRFLPQIISGCLEGRSFPVSNGEQLRDFCLIDDVVSAIFAVFNKPEARGEVFNIASGSPVTIRRVIELVNEFIGSGEPQFGKIAYRPGENMKLYANISKASKILGWQPEVSMEEGLMKTIQSLRENI